jgi:Tfp pilus assembly protein PilP
MSLWRSSARSALLFGVLIVLGGCNSGDNVTLKDVGYKIDVQPNKKIEELPELQQPRKGQSSRQIKRDPSGVNRSRAN